MKKIVTFTALGLILAATNANAAGFHLREQSAAAQGNAFAGATAGAENISYAYFNVAGLTRHKGTQMNLGGTYIAPEASAHNIQGGAGEYSDVHNIVHAAVAPNMSFSHQLNDEVTVGLGVNVPFGMVTKYDTRWAGAHHGATSKVTAVTTTPMVAWKATDKLSIGAGLPIQYFKAKLTSGYNGTPNSVSINSGYSKVEGDTVDVGYQLGAMYELDENTRFGINYRSEINHKLKGEIESTGFLGAKGPFMNQDINARVDAPAMLSVGAYHKLNDKWELMAEYQRVYWNSFDSIDIYGSEMNVPVQGYISSTKENWRDANFYAIGASYQLDDQWKLRLGLAYDEAAVKLSDRTPRIPDSNRIWYSVGLGYQYSENLSIDAAFTYIKAKEASIDMSAGQNAAMGPYDVTADYTNSVKMFGLSMNYSF